MFRFPTAGECFIQRRLSPADRVLSRQTCGGDTSCDAISDIRQRRRRRRCGRWPALRAGGHGCAGFSGHLGACAGVDARAQRPVSCECRARHSPRGESCALRYICCLAGEGAKGERQPTVPLQESMRSDISSAGSKPPTYDNVLTWYGNHHHPWRQSAKTFRQYMVSTQPECGCLQG